MKADNRIKLSRLKGRDRRLRGNRECVIKISDNDDLDPQDDNVDVEVRFPDGNFYTATFLTLGNVQTLLEKFKSSGECSQGLYFWCPDMILISQLDHESIIRTVQGLLDEGELTEAFKGPYRDDE